MIQRYLDDNMTHSLRKREPDTVQVVVELCQERTFETTRAAIERHGGEEEFLKYIEQVVREEFLSEFGRGLENTTAVYAEAIEVE